MIVCMEQKIDGKFLRVKRHLTNPFTDVDLNDYKEKGWQFIEISPLIVFDGPEAVEYVFKRVNT